VVFTNLTAPAAGRIAERASYNAGRNIIKKLGKSLKNGLRPTQERGIKMKRIYAYTVVYGKPSTLHIFENKEAIVSYAANSGRLEATKGKPTIDQLLKALGMTRVYASELNKYKLNTQYHYDGLY
jgi:hypothetical protein